jgi:rhamnulose-1-phosphate aldolase/alcohol dehydrogenase
LNRVDDLWPVGRLDHNPLEQVLLASHLLGANRAVANFGGGNTSAKGLALDHRNRTVDAIWVKASGSDLATLGPEAFAVLRLDDLAALYTREEMSDEDMVGYLAHCQLEPAAPRPSIETLLHAFIPAAHVHHTHPDAINALACAREGERLVRECFGGRAAWISYVRPGFELAKEVGRIVRSGAVELVVLAKHGLVIWGDTAEEAYRRTVAAINKAADFANAQSAHVRFPEPTRSPDESLLPVLLPILRGALSSDRPKIVLGDFTPDALEFVSSPSARELAATGAACPDHLVHTKRLPLWVPFDPKHESSDVLGDRVREEAAAYRETYRLYVETYGHGRIVASDADARIVLLQNLGVVAVGANVQAAKLSQDLYRRAIAVMNGAHALGGFASLTAAESFAVEYWPLELYKLNLAPPPGELEGKVAFVTGAAGAVGSAVTEALAAAGAAVVGFDIDEVGVIEALERYGDSALAVGGDVTSETAVAAAFSAAVRRFGGIDIVVSNAGIASSASVEDTTLIDWNRTQLILGTGYFLVAREAFRVLRRQGMGGAVVFVASKNALVAGRHAAAYSAAKAGELHLARCLAAEGGDARIRVNVVNPDAVLHGSRIWNSTWRQERAAAYGITPDDLEEHYRNRTSLGVNVLATDVAEAVMHFASARRSGKSTGNILNVDGGVAAAFPR